MTTFNNKKVYDVNFNIVEVENIQAIDQIYLADLLELVEKMAFETDTVELGSQGIIENSTVNAKDLLDVNI